MLELLNTMGTFEVVLNIFLHSKMAMRAGRKTQSIVLRFDQFDLQDQLVEGENQLLELVL